MGSIKSTLQDAYHEAGVAAMRRIINSDKNTNVVWEWCFQHGNMPTIKGSHTCVICGNGTSKDFSIDQVSRGGFGYIYPNSKAAYEVLKKIAFKSFTDHNPFSHSDIKKLKKIIRDEGLTYQIITR